MLNGKGPAIPRIGAGPGGRGSPSACRHCTGKPIEAKRWAIRLQTVCVLYFGDGCGGDKGRPVIGEGKRGDWGDVGLTVIGGVRGLPPAANGRLRTSVFICGSNSPAPLGERPLNAAMFAHHLSTRPLPIESGRLYTSCLRASVPSCLLDLFSTHSQKRLSGRAPAAPSAPIYRDVLFHAKIRNANQTPIQKARSRWRAQTKPYRQFISCAPP